jgi:acyl dehydratase
MATRTLKSPPILPLLYLRSAAPMIPGASLLPFVPGGGREMPQIELALTTSADPEKVAAYAKVCGFTVGEHLPPTYPHVLAFPLHMAVMADGRFPFGAVGLVHIENRIVQRRPIAVGERLTIQVRPTALAPHRRGRAFTLVTQVSVGGEAGAGGESDAHGDAGARGESDAGGEVVWEGFSTMLRRGGGQEQTSPAEPRGASGESAKDVGPGEREAADREAERELAAGSQPSAVWRLPGDLGRRYAAVSGDRNPIHMHPLSARLLGFPAAIAHGMWSKARCVAALQSRLPDAFEVSVSFRKPILLPAEVQFASTLADGRDVEAQGEIGFSLRDARKGTPHLDGRVATERSSDT